LWVHFVGLIDPHVEAHLAIIASGCDQSLVDKLRFDDGLPRNQRELALVQLLLNYSFVVDLIVFAIIDWPVNFEIDLLIANKVEFEYFLSVFLRRVLLLLELKHVRWRLSVVVHLQLV